MMAIMQMHVHRNLLVVHLKKIIQPHCIAAFLGLKNNINAKEMHAIEGNISHFACFENIKCAGTSFSFVSKMINMCIFPVNVKRRSKNLEFLEFENAKRNTKQSVKADVASRSV